MIPSAARALERVFGAVLDPGATVLRVVALLALAVVLGKAIEQAIRAIRARRHGWETATVVRCGTCGAFAADPSHPWCPEGHAVRFPAGAASREGRRRARRSAGNGSVRPDRLLFAAAGALVILAISLAAARACRIIDFRTPALAAAAGAIAFLFFAAALALGLRSVSPAPRMPLDRVLSIFGGGIALAPAVIFLTLCRTADPPPPRAIGSVWATPSALYTAPPGGRGRRIASPAPASLELELVRARSPLLAWSWSGVARFSAGGGDLAWPGSGGIRARLFGRLPAHALEPLLSVERVRERVDTPANVRIWIVRSGDRISFSAQANGNPEFDAIR